MGNRILRIKDKLKKSPIHPSFILFFLWFVFTKNLPSFFMFAVVVLSHELGHFLVARKLGYKLDSFTLAPYGISLNYKDKVFESRDEVLIALAGPLVNIILSLVLVSLWWVVPDIYNYTDTLVSQSFLLGIFNLLPCYPLDGGRIMVGLLQKTFSRDRAIKITRIFNYLFSALLFLLFFITCFIDFNPTLCLCGVFLIIGIIDSKFECKYQPISLLKKENKNFSRPSFYTVSSDVKLSSLLKHIELNKLTIFVVSFKNGKTIFLDEEKVKRLALNFSINTTLSEIFKQEKE